MSGAGEGRHLPGLSRIPALKWPGNKAIAVQKNFPSPFDFDPTLCRAGRRALDGSLGRQVRETWVDPPYLLFLIRTQRADFSALPSPDPRAYTHCRRVSRDRNLRYLSIFDSISIAQTCVRVGASVSPSYSVVAIWQGD